VCERERERARARARLSRADKEFKVLIFFHTTKKEGKNSKKIERKKIAAEQSYP
jgi:hypothetical protein